VFGQTAQDYFDKAYNNESDWQYKIDNYTKAIELENKWVAAYFNRGFAYDELGYLEKAIKDYTSAIYLDPKFSSAYFNRGFIYKNSANNYMEAISDFNQSIKLEPNNSDAYYERGGAYLFIEKYTLALSDLSMAIKFNPLWADAYYDRGVVKFYMSLDGCSDLIKAKHLGFVVPVGAISAIEYFECE